MASQIAPRRERRDVKGEPDRAVGLARRTVVGSYGPTAWSHSVEAHFGHAGSLH
jgi:hypothetical protein